MATLVFIDTNIWLDFYRVRGKQADLAFLEKIDENRDRLISGDQVEMEFKKNRQRVILDSYRGLNPPDLGGLKLPAFLAQSKQSSGLETGKKKIKEHLKTLRARTENIFSNPTRYDPVYKVAQRVFRQRGSFNLTRRKKERHSIRRLACKRFVLGYPPRKPGDTSIGDAINWEWIVRCATESGEDIVIVSRDSDFGQGFNGKPHLNDWLLQEFKERVSRKRSIVLTDRLSEAFKRAAINVTKDEEAAENEFLKARPPQDAAERFFGGSDAAQSIARLQADLNRVAASYQAQLDPFNRSIIDASQRMRSAFLSGIELGRSPIIEDSEEDFTGTGEEGESED